MCIQIFIHIGTLHDHVIINFKAKAHVHCNSAEIILSFFIRLIPAAYNLYNCNNIFYDEIVKYIITILHAASPWNEAPQIPNTRVWSIILKSLSLHGCTLYETLTWVLRCKCVLTICYFNLLISERLTGEPHIWYIMTNDQPWTSDDDNTM